MTISPYELTSDHLRSVIDSACPAQRLQMQSRLPHFSSATRYADALKFAMPSEVEFDKAAEMLLKRGSGA
jgi:hypothetical protein